MFFARWTAVNLTELYNCIMPKSNLGLYSYPGPGGGTSPASQQHITLGQIDTKIQAFHKRLDWDLQDPLLIKPKDEFAWTPMAEGIKEVWQVLHPNKPPNSRAAVFHIGDGQHNVDSVTSYSPEPVRPTPADWYNASVFQNGG